MTVKIFTISVECETAEQLSNALRDAYHHVMANRIYWNHIDCDVARDIPTLEKAIVIAQRAE